MSAVTFADARGLARVLAMTLPFVGDDYDTLPNLCAVRVEAARGVLVATATNRYVVGQARTTADDGLVEGELPATSLPTGAVKQVIKACGGNRKNAPRVPATLALVDEPGRPVKLTVDGDDILIAPELGAFPPVEHLLRKTLKTARLTSALGLRGDLLAKLGAASQHVHLVRKVSGDGAPPIVFYPSGEAHKLVHFTIGDSFRGAIMPVRIGVIAAPSVPIGLPTASAGEAP